MQQTTFVTLPLMLPESRYSWQAQHLSHLSRTETYARRYCRYSQIIPYPTENYHSITKLFIDALAASTQWRRTHSRHFRANIIRTRLTKRKSSHNFCRKVRNWLFQHRSRYISSNNNADLTEEAATRVVSSSQKKLKVHIAVTFEFNAGLFESCKALFIFVTQCLYQRLTGRVDD